jgi:hypothetical protein
MGHNLGGWVVKEINNFWNYPFLKINNHKNFHLEEPTFTTVTTLNSERTLKDKKK